MKNNLNTVEWAKLLDDPNFRDKLAVFLSNECSLSPELCGNEKVVDTELLQAQYTDQSIFMALMHRQSGITRWTKSQSIVLENLNDHVVAVAQIALLIGAHHKTTHPDSHITPERLAVMALFHDSQEILSEDLSTLVKSINETIRFHAKETESIIAGMISETIDPLLRPIVKPLFMNDGDETELDFIKAADLISAYVRAKSELRSNNGDYAYAAGQLRLDIERYIKQYDSVKYVFEHYVKAYSLTMDQLIHFLPKN